LTDATIFIFALAAASFTTCSTAAAGKS